MRWLLLWSLGCGGSTEETGATSATGTTSSTTGAPTGTGPTTGAPTGTTAPSGWSFVQEVAVSDALSDQHHATHARAADGSWLVAYDNAPPGDKQVVVRAFDDALQPLDDPHILDQIGGEFGRPDPAPSATGWMVTWHTRLDVMLNRTDPVGNAVGAVPVQVNVVRGVDPDKGQPDMTALDDGSFVVVYHLADLAAYPVSTYYQRRFSADLLPLGDEEIVGVSPEIGSPPDVTATPDGGWVVGWSDRTGPGGSVHLSWYDAAGNPSGSATTDNVDPAHEPSRPNVAVDAAGRTVVMWRIQDDLGIGLGAVAQFYGANHAPLGPAIVLDPEGQRSSVGAAGDLAVFVWEDDPTAIVWAQPFDTATQLPLTDPFIPFASGGAQHRPSATPVDRGDHWEVVFTIDVGPSGQREVLMAQWDLYLDP